MRLQQVMQNWRVSRMIKIEPIVPEELDRYVAKNHPEANFLQSSGWGKVYELDGEKVFYLGYMLPTHH